MRLREKIIDGIRHHAPDRQHIASVIRSFCDEENDTKFEFEDPVSKHMRHFIGLFKPSASFPDPRKVQLTPVDELPPQNDWTENPRYVRTRLLGQIASMVEDESQDIETIICVVDQAIDDPNNSELVLQLVEIHEQLKLLSFRDRVTDAGTVTLAAYWVRTRLAAALS